MEKTGGDMHWAFPVCGERIRCPLPDPSSDGGDQSSLWAAKMYTKLIRNADCGVKEKIFTSHSEFRNL